MLHTPGHTPACVSYLIGDAAFVGDTLFMPDYGTARSDFPGGSASDLYRSIRKILALPGETRMFVGHDYLPEGRNDYRWETSVAEQNAANVQIRDGVSEADFVAVRDARDAALEAPLLILPSLQVNIRAGAMPPAFAGRACLSAAADQRDLMASHARAVTMLYRLDAPLPRSPRISVRGRRRMILGRAGMLRPADLRR